jgi:hypothetical protein
MAKSDPPKSVDQPIAQKLLTEEYAVLRFVAACWGSLTR